MSLLRKLRRLLFPLFLCSALAGTAFGADDEADDFFGEEALLSASVLFYKYQLLIALANVRSGVKEKQELWIDPDERHALEDKRSKVIKDIQQKFAEIGEVKALTHHVFVELRQEFSKAESSLIDNLAPQEIFLYGDLIRAFGTEIDETKKLDDVKFKKKLNESSDKVVGHLFRMLNAQTAPAEKRWKIFSDLLRELIPLQVLVIRSPDVARTMRKILKKFKSPIPDAIRQELATPVAIGAAAIMSGCVSLIAVTFLGLGNVLPFESNSIWWPIATSGAGAAAGAGGLAAVSGYPLMDKLRTLLGFPEMRQFDSLSEAILSTHDQMNQALIHKLEYQLAENKGLHEKNFSVALLRIIAGLQQSRFPCGLAGVARRIFLPEIKY